MMAGLAVLHDHSRAVLLAPAVLLERAGVDMDPALAHAPWTSWR
jgi:hypothetical protein